MGRNLGLTQTVVQQSISEGIPWNPPDGPTPEGTIGSEDLPPEQLEEI